VLFAGGAVFITRFIENYKIKWLRPVAAVITAVFTLLILRNGILSIPYCRPVLSPEAFIKYSGGQKFTGDENYDSGLLPQNFADCFGWEELTENVAGVYQNLHDSEKKKACILAVNYGEAGALHYYGPKYGLPEPISSHNIWYIWGPGNNTGDVMIIVVSSNFYKFFTILFDSVEITKKTRIKYAMPFENENAIFLCRGLHWPLKKLLRFFKIFG
jgi:hypothetical protein